MNTYSSSMTMQSRVFRPATHELRPEKKITSQGGLDRLAKGLFSLWVPRFKARLAPFRDLANDVVRLEKKIAGLSGPEMQEEISSVRLLLRQHGLADELIVRSFALIREVADRAVGMRHFPCQLMGGAILLRGMVAEMDTGEGKTLTATLAAGTAALAGIPVHVVSVNDYLTARDAKDMGSIYQALGLTVGCVIHDVEPLGRRAAYMRDVVYCTNKEVVFDYLRDTITLGDCAEPLRLNSEYLFGGNQRVRRVLLRGLHYCIVDEADSILIDEARVPLLISRESREVEEVQFLEQAYRFAVGLQVGMDFRIDSQRRTAEFTESGRQRITIEAYGLGPLWTGRVRREEAILQALSAIHLFRQDEHYLVRDGKVQIVDEFTGRLMPDRSWERGLHQLIEIKEKCEVSGRRETVARISFQRFFSKYLHLAGMTGTAMEVRGELWRVYGLAVVPVPSNRPSRRKALPEKILPTLEEKWQAILARIQQLAEEGRPVLLGTRSVAVSEHLSRLLHAHGLEHQVLNAKFDLEEAEIIAKAGTPGRITIATNMAGRGTDIKLARSVRKSGGLHVVLTELHEAARIDRQLAGRCGRQGDAGSYEAILSMEDPLVADSRGGVLGKIVVRMLPCGSMSWQWLGNYAIRRAQKRIERIHSRMRSGLLRQDQKLQSILSFAGRT